MLWKNFLNWLEDKFKKLALLIKGIINETIVFKASCNERFGVKLPFVTISNNKDSLILPKVSWINLILKFTFLIGVKLESINLPNYFLVDADII